MAVCGCGLQTSPSHYIPISWWSCDKVTSVSESSISVTQTLSVSLHVMSSAHVRAWHQDCGKDGFNLQYPAVPNQYPDVQSRLVGRTVQTWRRKEIILHRVHQFLWCPEDQADRWDDLGNVVAVQLSRLHQHQLPPYHHCLQFHNQFTCNILPLPKTEPTIASDVKILWIFYQTFVDIRLVQ